MVSYTSHYHTLKRPHDFRVKYQFLPRTEGSSSYVVQGARFDFRYTNDGHLKNSHYIIWPEFEDDGGFTILDQQLPVPQQGTAKMWVINQSLREYHRLHLKIGSIGYMTRAGADIASCEVIELGNLDKA